MVSGDTRSKAKHFITLYISLLRRKQHQSYSVRIFIELASEVVERQMNSKETVILIILETQKWCYVTFTYS